MIKIRQLDWSKAANQFSVNSCGRGEMFGFANHFMKNEKSFNEVLGTDLAKFCKLKLFVFLCLLKLLAKTFISTQISSRN